MLEVFKKYQAQTTENPLGLIIKKAKGCYIYDNKGNKYLDFVAGVSANVLGHSNRKIIRAIKVQAKSYLHVMVYGEFALSPAVEYCKKLSEVLPEPLNSTYLVNSGTEAIEAAIKLARAYTGNTKIVAAKDAYHGNTMGSLSLMSLKERMKPFEPLIPDISHIRFNNEDDISIIDDNTAAVVLETIQGGAGFISPKTDYLIKIANRCRQTKTLLILDEIQPGFGRTGKWFAFEHYNIQPDILVIGKAMAGGLPSGAIVSSQEIMKTFSQKIPLGHITTFGGNPLIANAALATLNEIIRLKLTAKVKDKEQLFRTKLIHPLIKEVRGKGLMLALILQDALIANELVIMAKEKKLILFWLLFEKRAVRITPPLTVSEKEIKKGCQIILSILDELQPNVD
tara:strand:- start:5607 stop:6797 length:1191 start_codon:yes stop_codon:yes gene_type:complete